MICQDISTDFSHYISRNLVRSKESNLRHFLFIFPLFSYVAKANDQLSFLIRLLGQFSSSEKNHFADQFTTKDGKILYYKIYQSVWKNKVANTQNLKQLAALFKGIEENALKHLSDITGDYSFPKSVGNLITFIEGLVDGEKFEAVMSNIKGGKKATSIYTKVITVFISQINQKQSVGSVITRLLYATTSVMAERTWLETFTGLDNADLNQMKYQTLERQMNEFLVAIGKIKIKTKYGKSTINEIVQASIPRMKQGVNKFYQEYLSQNSQYIQSLNNAKQQVSKAFDHIEESLGETLNQKNSFLKMLLDLLVPSLDGIHPTVARILNKNYNREVENATMMRLKRMCTEKKTSRFNCNFIIFYEEMRTAKKDTTFVSKLLDSVERLSLQVLENEIKDTTQEKKMVNV